MTRPLPNKTILRVALAGVVLLLFCGASVGAAAGADNYQVGSTKYETLSAAYGAAADNATITVLANVTENSQVTMDGTKSVTLDLNGKTITAGSGTFTDGLIKWDTSGTQKLTITDSSNPSTGKLDGGGKTRVLSINAGEAELEKGTITGGKADWGGGVKVAGGKFTMFDGTISGNNATTESGGSGGGVSVEGGTFAMTGGSITGNTAQDGGGGVYVNNGTFTMSDGSITENTANGSSEFYGGGGGVFVKKEFTMTGGIITDNTASMHGGGVRVKDGTFNVSGTPVISGNKKGDADNNVYLIDETQLKLVGPLTRGTAETPGADIRINSPTTGNFATGVAASDTQQAYSVSAADAPCFHPDSGTLTAGVTTQSGGTGAASTLGWGTPVAQRGDIQYISVQDAVNDTAASGDITMIADSTESTVVIDKTVTLNLKGYVLSNKNDTPKTVNVNGTNRPSTSVIFVASGGNLTVMDDTKTEHYFTYNSAAKWNKTDTTSDTPISAFDRSAATSGSSVYYVEGGCITGGLGIKVGDSDNNYHGGGVYVDIGGRFTLSKGNIIGNSATQDAGGVYIGGTFTMSDGCIAGNFAPYGGGVRIDSITTSTMTGGLIVGNTASTDGGGVEIGKGSDPEVKFAMSGTACIKGNSATNGGGVWVGHGDSFTMSETASITGNTAANGGGVYVTGTAADKKSTFTMSSDASIKGNTATGTNNGNGGGGVFVAKYGEFMMENGTIDDNTATKDGGGVLIHADDVANASEFTMSGGSIENNTAATGGGVMIHFKGSFEMSGNASIKGNTAADFGGGVDAWSGRFEMKGGEIKGNEVTGTTGNCGYGGGVYVNNACPFTMSSGTIGGSNPGDENSAKYGGGVSVGGPISSATTTFEMSGGTITGNTAVNGGGVYVTGTSADKKGTFTMSGDASIKGNTATGNNTINGGGGVFVNANGELTMNGGTIGGESPADGNRTTGSNVPAAFWIIGGGGVFINGGSVTMSGTAKLQNNVAGPENDTHHSGGGVFVNDNGELTMKDSSCSIVGNSANHDGGGVYIRDGTFIMNNNSSITKNSSKGTSGGGGVCLWGGTFEMTGGRITENSTINEGGNNEGGGVHVNNGTFKVSGAPFISGNTKGTGKTATANNVYLQTGTTITINMGTEEDPKGLAAGCSIGVTTATAPTADTPVNITNAYSATDYSDKFTSDNTSYGVKYNSEGKTIQLTLWKVTFDMQGHGTQIPSITGVLNGAKISEPTAPTADGYTFGGWYKEAACENKWKFDGDTNPDTVTKDTTLYAKWTAVNTVTLDPQGGTGGTASVTAYYGQAMPSATMPTKSGYTFNGYFDATSGGTQYYTAAGASAKNWDKTVDTTLYAQWTAVPEPGPVTWNVRFNADGGHPKPDNQTVEDGKCAVEPQQPEKDGYSFTGWYKDGAVYNFSTPVTANITLTAGWSEDPAAVWTVTFDAAGGWPVPDTQQVLNGTYAKEPQPAPEKGGYTFSGWLKNGSVYSFGTPVTADLYLTAGWKIVDVTPEDIPDIIDDIIETGEPVVVKTTEENIETVEALIEEARKYDVGDQVQLDVTQENLDAVEAVIEDVGDPENPVPVTITPDNKEAVDELLEHLDEKGETAAVSAPVDSAGNNAGNIVSLKEDHPDLEVTVPDTIVISEGEQVTLPVNPDTVEVVHDISAAATSGGCADQLILDLESENVNVKGAVTILGSDDVDGDSLTLIRVPEGTELSTEEKIEEILPFEVIPEAAAESAAITGVENISAAALSRNNTNALETDESLGPVEVTPGFENFRPLSVLQIVPAVKDTAGTGTVDVTLTFKETPVNGKSAALNYYLKHYTTGVGWDEDHISPVKTAANRDGTISCTFRLSGFSPFALVYETPVEKKKGGSSPDEGTSVWLTAAPTPTPTPVPGYEIPTVKPTKTATPTPTETKPAASPVPFMGVLAGLGAVLAVVFAVRMRR